VSFDLELALLGKLVDADSVLACWDQGLRAEVLEDPFHQEIFSFVIEYWMREGMALAPTEQVVRYEFSTYEPQRTEESLTWLIDKLKTRYVTNRLQELMRSAAGTSVDDPVSSLETLYIGSWEAKQVTAPRHNRVNVATTIDSRRRRYSERQQQQSLSGAPLGLAEVDEHTNGTLPGELAVVAGYAKTGKSFTLVNAAVQARKAGYTPCLFTLEQAIPEFEDRIDCLASGVGYGKMQRGELTMTEVRRLHTTQEEMAAFGPLHLERPGRGERSVVNLVNRARQIGSDYLIIDQLSWLETAGRYRERRDEYRELIYDLKEEISRASSGELPCLMAVQYNRQAVSTRGERGGLHNIANAADIEQAVDIAYGLWRNRETRANNSMVLDVLGSRRSDVQSWMLGWVLDQESRIFVREVFTEDGVA